MIQKINIRNFLSLNNTTVELGPMNIFVGPNGAGKSAIFKALIALSRLMHQPLRGEKGNFEIGSTNFDRLVREGNESRPVCFDVWFDSSSKESQYSLEIRKLGSGWSVTKEQFRLPNLQYDSDSDPPIEHGTERWGTKNWEMPNNGTLPALLYRFRNDTVAKKRITPFLEFNDMIGSTWRYRPSPSMIADIFYPTQNIEAGGKETYVNEVGWALPVVLNRQLGQERETFLLIESQLMKWFPHIKGIDFESVKQGIRLSFRTTRSQKPIPAEMESDGVLTALFLLWRLHAREENVNICIEEPENSTHPYLLKDRYNYIKQIVNSPTFGNSRLLIATQSPDFLEAVGVEDALSTIQVVEFSPKKGTQVTKLRDLADVDKLFEIFRGNMGELWWSGAIGGVPKND